MAHHHNLIFSQQDLRNRSFRGQNLADADFSGSDLRGCDFRNAGLWGARFDNARVGPSRRQFIARMAVVFGVAFVVKEAIAHLVFGAIGATWEASEWSLIVLLLFFLATIGVTAQIATRPKTILSNQPIWAITGLLNGALLGFFYAGTLFNKNPITVFTGAIVGVGLMTVLLSTKPIRGILRVGVATSSAIATYGFAFYMGNWTIAALSAGQWLLTLGFGGIAVLYLGLTTHQIARIVWLVRHLPGTFFQGADLTHATFDNIKLHLTDLPKHPPQILQNPPF